MINLKDAKGVRRKVDEIKNKRNRKIRFLHNEKTNTVKTQTVKTQKKLNKKEQERKKKWIKFLIKFIALEYITATIILLTAFIYSNIKNVNKLENVIKEQQTTISYLINLVDESNDNEEIEEKHVKFTDYSEKNKGLFRITAYCSCEKCCGKWAVLNGGGYTASGTKVEEGRTIAVFKNQIPFGTEVHIEGMGTYIAEDTGSAIKENCIDVYFDSHEEAKQFGVQYRNVMW